MEYMFDTNALNKIIKGGVDTARFDKNNRYYITPVQRGEIEQTADLSLRRKLLRGLEVVEGSAPATSVEIRTAPWGHFPWGHGPWGGGDGKYYAEVMRRLSECPRNKNPRGNNCDALIIEVCKMNRITLVTNDRAGKRVCNDLGVPWLTLDEFLGGMVGWVLN